jgi:WD40 repeat protein
LFGDYELVGVLGRGGMGAVYRARQRSLNRLVALKMIRAGEPAGPADVRRFRTEAEVVAQLEHPNIVPVYEVGEREGLLYLSMRLVEGGTLSDRLDQFTADLRAAARLVATVARAIHFVHQHGVLHRDLKPGNILVDSDGQPLVTDFGLAKRVEGDSSLTQSGAIVGTPSYVAPEQACGAKGGATIAADVWGLGAVLYTCLTGRPPFRGETVLETLEQVKTRDPELPRRLNPRVDRDLETICLKCLHKEPARRYSSAEALAEDLERWLRWEPIQARPPGLLQHVSRWAGRHQAVVAAAVITLVLAVVTLATSTWLIARSRQETVTYRKEAEDRARDLWRQGYPADIGAAHRAWQAGNLKQARELLARYLPQEGQEELRGFEWYFLWDQCRPLETRTLAGHSGWVYCVTFSPDGKLLASASKDHTIRLWDVGAGRELAVLRGHRGEVNNVFFSPDGKSLASWSDDGTARFWEVATRRELLAWSAPEGTAIGAAFLPDGTRVVLVLRESAFEWWDIAKGRKRQFPLGRKGVRLYSGALSRDGKRLALGEDGDRASIWDLDEAWDVDRPRLLHVFPLPNAARELAFSPDGKRLAAVGDSGFARLFALDPYREVAVLPDQGGQVLGVAISPDGRTLASGGEDSALRLWDAPSRMGRAGIPTADVIRCVAFSPDGRLLASGGVDHRVRLHSLPVRSPAVRLHEYRDKVNSLRVSPDGQTLATAYVFAPQDRVSLLWDRKTGRLRAPQLPGPALKEGGAIAYSPDSKTLAVPTWGGRVVALFDVGTGRPHTASLAGCCQAFTPDSQTVVTGTLEGDIRLWDTATGAPRGRIGELQSSVTCVACTPDGRTLASGHADGQVWLWDLVTGRRHDAQLPRHRGEVRFLVFTPDGQTLVTASENDDEIHIWDVDRWQMRTTFTARSHRLKDLGLSPDGRTLALADQARITLFHVATGQELFSLERHWTGDPSVNFAPDGRSLLTGVAEGGELMVWQAPRVGPDLPDEEAARPR